MRVEHHPKIARLSRKGKVQNPISHLPRKSESPTSPHILHVRRKNESPTSPQYCTLPRKSESLTSCSTAPFYAKFPECATPCFSMFTLRCFSCIGSFSTKFRLNDHADQGGIFAIPRDFHIPGAFQGFEGWGTMFDQFLQILLANNHSFRPPGLSPPGQSNLLQLQSHWSLVQMARGKVSARVVQLQEHCAHRGGNRFCAVSSTFKQRSQQKLPQSWAKCCCLGYLEEWW